MKASVNMEAVQVAKPILFNTEMVKAILENRKTVTRRVIKFDTAYPNAVRPVENPIGLMTTSKIIRPPYQVGDILYVRETWGEIGGVDDREYIYRADDDMGTDRWHPSIHMPKEAARIFLRVTNVRVERLQDITEKQAIAEGIRIGMGGEPHFSCRDAYAPLWNSTIKKFDLDKYSWDANPWVTVNEFERISKEEATK